MRRRLVVLFTCVAVGFGAAACGGKAVSEPEGLPDTASSNAAFSYASPESQGLSSEALGQLADAVRGYFEQDMIVGAELVVVKNRRVVLHEAIGWKDREEEIPMVPNTLFNIRSMTKPVVGTAIQMLIDEGKLSLEDRASEYLAAFDNDKSAEITIEHLLTHRSGLPYTRVSNLADYASLQEIARQAGESGPAYEPGSRFEYSDDGADTLAAILEQVSGASVEAFYEQRILGPLSMKDTLTLIDKTDPITERIASAYVGLQGAWTRYWSPKDAPIFAFAMGSVSLYSTPNDYARFLALWMDDGRVGEQRLLSPQAIARALAPVSDMGYAINFPGLKTYYAQMWTVYIDPRAPAGAGPVLFGHTGIDGTWAWAWPERDLIVLYFTQSRGQATGVRLEAEINRLLIHPGAEEEVADVPEPFKPYLGVYTARSGPLRNQEFTVLVQNGNLAVDIPNQIVVELYPPDERGLWRFTVDPTIAVSFERDDAGEVSGMRIYVDGDITELSKGSAPPEPELDLEAVQGYLGSYRDEAFERDVQVIIHNNHLAIKAPESSVVRELYPPDEEGKWYVRLDPTLAVSFNASDDGRIESLTVHTPDGDYVWPRVEPGEGQ